MHPSDPTRRKIPSFESAYEIVLTDAKFITKQQYSGDIWPLKVKRNCIVDKSLSKFILFSYLKMQWGGGRQLRKKFFGTKSPNNLQVFNHLNLAAL
jgi:hypothetical protein